MKKNATPVLLPLIIASNLFPLYGALRYNWTIFSVVYVYWLELLIITGFQILKMLYAQGDPESGFFLRLWTALKFLLFRLGIFFFYLLFIVAFLGFLTTGNLKFSHTGMMETILFRNPFFNVVLLNFVAYNLVEFIVMYLLTKEYKKAKAPDYFEIFDPHMIVVHIVVVLGTFLYQFLLQKVHADQHSAMIAIVCLFILVKIIIDIGRQRMNAKPEEKEVGKYI